MLREKKCVTTVENFPILWFVGTRSAFFNTKVLLSVQIDLSAGWYDYLGLCVLLPNFRSSIDVVRAKTFFCITDCFCHTHGTSAQNNRLKKVLYCRLVNIKIWNVYFFNSHKINIRGYVYHIYRIQKWVCEKSYTAIILGSMEWFLI